jgi:Glycosyl transferase family 2
VLDHRGDFFYEDNAFHWTTMIHAESVSKIERVFFHHRRERKGQTSSNFHLRGTESGGNINTMETIKKVSAAAKLGGMLPNLFQMGNDTISRGMSLPSNVSAADLFAVQQSTRAYFAKVKATSWIGKRQLSAQMQQKFARRLAQISNHWFENANPSTLSMVDSAIREFDSSAENVDLSIIIPTYNVGIRVLEVLYSLYAQLPDSQFSFEVLVVDDGSSDDITARLLLEFASQQKPNFYLLSTASTLGAGRARNMAIPLVEGRYVYFADADDGFNFDALKEAVKYAASNNIDLLVLPYFVEQVHSESPPTRMIGMMPSDERIWKRIRESGNNLTQTEKRDAALALINYPWKQLTRSDLMFNAHVYFGPTVVHNDVQFHWTSIAASRNTSFYFGEEICVHRKFDPTVRGQLTQVSGKKRMEAFAAIHLTQRALTLEGAFDAESDGRDAEAMVEMDIDNSEVLALWKNFTKALLSWGSNKVPAELLPELTSKRKVLLDGLAMLGSIPEDDPLPYWRTEIITGNANHAHTNSIAFV